MLESRLLYGWYPDVVTHPGEAAGEAAELLAELANVPAGFVRAQLAGRVERIVQTVLL
ncbi:MAG: hypothetical protein LBG60_06810 [Bifidobacteriaceae bacterium]|jgi:hypothetical protein|nr:hypothetical protein [Bifidobacteriaceae bacterium]